MLLNRAELEAIRDDGRDLVFRRWRRPTVRAGGTLRTAIGELSIHEVAVVEPDEIDDAQARRAGFPDAAAVLEWLFAPRAAPARARTAAPDADSPIYRVRVSYLGADPRVALRQQRLARSELAAMVTRVQAMDTRSARPWAQQALALIRRWPARRAPELAELAGWETAPWKANVRRLKELGLTESLPVGYRLSPRGSQVDAALRRRARAARPEAPDGD